MIHTRMSCCNGKSLRKVKFLFLSVPFTWKYTSCGKLLKNTFQWHYSGWRKNVSIPSEKTNPLCAVEQARGTSESDSESDSQDVQTKVNLHQLNQAWEAQPWKEKLQVIQKGNFHWWTVKCITCYLFLGRANRNWVRKLQILFTDVSAGKKVTKKDTLHQTFPTASVTTATKNKPNEGRLCLILDIQTLHKLWQVHMYIAKISC